jgi:hypothetical protein
MKIDVGMVFLIGFSLVAGCRSPKPPVTVTGAGPNDPNPDHIRVGGTDFAFPPGAYPITATSTSKVIDANCGGTVKGKATVRASDDTILAKVSFTAICGDCDA